ncbi:MAG: phage recombination protein Bet [Thermomicrobiales bacterium]
MTAQNGLAVRGSNGSVLDRLTEEKRDLLKRTIAKGATDDELELALTMSATWGLDPFAKQIAFVKRWDSSEERHVMSIQPTIDGARLLAQRSGKYGGQLGPWWCGKDGVWVEVWLEDGPPAAAKVGVINKDWEKPLFAVAKFSSYCARNKQGQPVALWRSMPELMIAKCAEMLALRRAFPAEFREFYGDGDERAVSESVNYGNVVDVQGSVSDRPDGLTGPTEGLGQLNREESMARLRAVAQGRSITDEQLTRIAVRYFGARESFEDLSSDQLALAIGRIEHASVEALAEALAQLEGDSPAEAAQDEPDANLIEPTEPTPADEGESPGEDLGAQVEKEFLDAIAAAMTSAELIAIGQRISDGGISTEAIRLAYQARTLELKPQQPAAAGLA